MAGNEKKCRRNRQIFFFTISAKKVIVDSDAPKGSQDERTKANKPGLIARQELLARLTNASTQLATGSRKSLSKNSVLAKDISQGPLLEMVVLMVVCGVKKNQYL